MSSKFCFSFVRSLLLLSDDASPTEQEREWHPRFILIRLVPVMPRFWIPRGPRSCSLSNFYLSSLYKRGSLCKSIG
jgi:hypothetical protein